MAKVYFLKANSQDNIIQKAKEIFACFGDFFNRNDRIAVKLHLGERNNKTSISPVFVKAIYENLKPKVKEIVLMDCSVLYKSERAFGESHKKLAYENGFDFAPIIIGDGKAGELEQKIKVNLKHFKQVKIGSELEKYNGILALTHFTGHSASCFGGAIKNIGMGLASKAGKLEQHEAFKIFVDKNRCTACSLCQKECPANAISFVKGKSEIDYKKCIGCGKCIAICPLGAIQIPWGSNSSNDLQERIAEYAFGALKNKKAYFVNVLLNITKKCDCVREKQEPFLKDVGILAGDDIAAIDKASLDLLRAKNFKIPFSDHFRQINYAQQIGLGKQEYELKLI